MGYLLDHPRPFFIVSLLVLWIAAQAGAWLRRRHPSDGGAHREDLSIILAATMTLLALIIGFSFSMSVNRYDQRKDLEEDEANAIGTEYVRAGLLTAGDTVKVRRVLGNYLAQRILFYTSQDPAQVEHSGTSTLRIQEDIWESVQGVAKRHPSPITALVASGMNDVLNSEGRTYASWANRIPLEAWSLMAAIAICCNMLIGYSGRPSNQNVSRFWILPLLVAIAFFLIADLDSPKGGLITIDAPNLQRLSQSLNIPASVK